MDTSFSHYALIFMISAGLSALIFAVFLQVFRRVGLLDNPGPY